MATYPKGKKFITKFMVDGERYVRTTKTKEAGEAWELAARAALKMGKPVPEPEGEGQKVGGRDAGTLANALRAAKQKHWSKFKTPVEHASLAAKVFVEWAGPNTSPRESFKPENIEKFFTYLKEERQVASGTLNRYSAGLSILAKHSDLDFKPEFEWVEPGEGRKRFFTEEEERAVIQLLAQWGKDKYLDFFMFEIDTGLRPWAEATKMKWSDIQRGQIYIPKANSKNKQGRYVPMTKRAKLVVSRQDKSLPGPWSDLNAYDADMLWARVRKVLKMPDTVWYTCRHTFCSRLVMNGVPILTGARLAGNSPAIFEGTYAHLSPNYLDNSIAVLDQYGEATNKTKLTLVK